MALSATFTARFGGTARERTTSCELKRVSSGLGAGTTVCFGYEKDFFFLLSDAPPFEFEEDALLGDEDIGVLLSKGKIYFLTRKTR